MKGHGCHVLSSDWSVCVCLSVCLSTCMCVCFCLTVCSINFDFTFDDAMATAFGCTVKCFDPRYRLCSVSVRLSVSLSVSMSFHLVTDSASNQIQAVVRKHNKPRPRVAHRGIVRFLRIGQKCNQVVPWSLHTFPEKFVQIGPAVCS